jgi:hypothetical protein
LAQAAKLTPFEFLSGLFNDADTALFVMVHASFRRRRRFGTEFESSATAQPAPLTVSWYPISLV